MILFNKEAKQELVEGVNILANAVKCTLGPAGRNVMISNDGRPYVTKDGVTVAKNVKLPNKFGQLGATVIKNVASKTCDQAGDGTTTSTVLAQAIINAGLEAINAGDNIISVKRGMDKALGIVVDSIKRQSIPIKDDHQLLSVATISANGDVEIGKIICEAMNVVKRKGIITVDPSEDVRTYVESVEGIQFSNGFLSPYFITNKAKMTAEFNKPIIIICKDKLKDLRDIMEALNEGVREKKEILVIVPDIESEVLNQLVLNHANGAIKCAVVKAPGFGDYQVDQIKDLYTLTGEAERGSYYIGSSEKVIISKETTTIINGHGNKDRLKDHINLLTAQLANEPYEMNQMKIRERLAKLQGGAAIIHVGALSEVEMMEKKDRIDDALNATRAALAEGIVPGGGVAYLNASELLTNETPKWDHKSDIVPATALFKNDSREMVIGMNIIKKALHAPYKAIMANAGYEIEGFKQEELGRGGYNAMTGKLEDFIKVGIVDPAKVTRCAIENAVSVAGMFLTTECCIINETDVLEKA